MPAFGYRAYFLLVENWESRKFFCTLNSLSLFSDRWAAFLLIWLPQKFCGFPMYFIPCTHVPRKHHRSFWGMLSPLDLMTTIFVYLAAVRAMPSAFPGASDGPL